MTKKQTKKLTEIKDLPRPAKVAALKVKVEINGKED